MRATVLGGLVSVVWMMYECTWGGGGIDKREELNEVGRGGGSTCKQSLNSGKRSPREATTTAGASSATETMTAKSRRWPLSSEERGSSRMASKGRRARSGGEGRKRDEARVNSYWMRRRSSPRTTVSPVCSPPAATSWLSRSHRSIPLTLQSPHIMRLV